MIFLINQEKSDLFLRKKATYHISDFPARCRFGKVGGAASLEAFFSIACHGKGRQGNNRDVGTPGPGANLPRDRKAITTR